MDKEITQDEIVNREIVYDGYNTVEKITVSNDGTEKIHELVNMDNVVCAIIKDVEKDKFIFVQQYRVGAEGVMVEVVAGKIDEGEKSDEAIKREIMEETGYKVDFTNHISDFYTSPGRTNEVCSMFYVEVSEKVHEGGGINGENIQIVEVEKLGLGGKIFFQDPMGDLSMDVETQMIPPYQLIDAKSIIAVSWLEHNNMLKDMSEVITQAKIRTL